MEVQELLFWVAVGILVCGVFLFFGKEIITGLIAVKVKVNP